MNYTVSDARPSCALAVVVRLTPELGLV